MASFPSYRTARRERAEPGKPLVDPAGWEPDELLDLERWSYHLTEEDKQEVLDGVAAMRKSGVPIEEISPDSFPLNRFAESLRDVMLELRDGYGAVRLMGFPIQELDREGVMMGYLGLSSYIGTLEPQNRYGHLIGHVKSFPDPSAKAKGRGYTSNIESSLHVDSTDFVGLMCIGEPRSGGESRVASTVTIYNRILKKRPDLVDALMLDFYKTRYGEERPGELPYYKSPVFAFVNGYFSAIGVSRKVREGDQIPGVPPYSDAQREAMDVFVEVAEECAIDMPFSLGVIQFLNNAVTLHSRRGFVDWDEPGRGRHMARVWLNDRDPRPIHQDRLERRNRGLYMKDVKREVPLDLAAPVPTN